MTTPTPENPLDSMKATFDEWLQQATEYVKDAFPKESDAPPAPPKKTDPTPAPTPDPTPDPTPAPKTGPRASRTWFGERA